MLVSDLLPGSRAGQDATVGITGLPDDPVTSALTAVAARRRGAWVGRPQVFAPYPWVVALRGLDVDDHDVTDYGAGQGRGTIWPLYHDLVQATTHDRRWRGAYRRVNTAYAMAAAEEAAHGATVWIHDYHLQLVPGLLRRLRPDLRIGFYLHTPFPSPDLFRHLPMSRDILHGLLGADVIGFQSAQAADNYLRLTQDPSDPPPAPDANHPPSGTSVGVYPTSVDAAAIAAIAARSTTAARAAELRTRLGNPATVILSIDTADATQGTGRRLRAIHDLYDGGAISPQEATIVQIVTPAADTDTGTDPTGDIAREVARLNGSFASVGRPPVHYLISAPNLQERVALYRAADVMAVTPLREGASQSALEFVAAAQPNAALVLSEFTGTAAALPEAFRVNPYDPDHTRAGILAALGADTAERDRRMRAMRSYVAGYDCHAWARSFLLALHTNDPRPPHVGDEAGPPFWPTTNPRPQGGAT